MFRFFLLSAIAFLSYGMASTSHAAPDKPNLIWIMADDLGWGEIGCYGQKVIQTPRIDAMAEEGLKLTHFYAGATICAPSRSVLMTGQHHGHTRVRGNAGPERQEAQALLPEDTTVADVLQKAGYRTALIGKWGLGNFGLAGAGLPWKHGFDEFFGYLSQGHAHNHYTDFLWRNEEKVSLPNKVRALTDYGKGIAIEGKVYTDDLFAEESLKFVEANQDRPFFLYWSMVVPHANNELAKETGDGAEVPDYGPYADKDWPNPDKGHAAMITRLDGYVGLMLDLLNKLDLAKNTLVIFTSDNGPHKESHQDMTRFRPSGPFTGIKRDLTDGGIRVPFVAWWPGVVKPSVSDQVAYFGDWFPTAAELAGAEIPDNLDAVSLVPLLKGDVEKQKSHEFLYWEHQGREFMQAALYEGRWKGIRTGAPDAPVVLHDLQFDVAEKIDVAAKNPEIAEKIGTYLQSARTPLETWEPIWSPKKKKGGK